MAVVRIRRSGRLSSSIALVLVLAALVALGWWSQQPASGGGGGAGGAPGATQQQQQQQTRGGGGGTGGSSSSSSRVSAWADVPEVSLSVQLPSWAGCPQPPCQYGQMADGAANTSVAYSSQFGEDVWLSQNLFYNKRGGFYVEMGAMNGVDLSNTRWFYQALGWKGLMIEACPGMAADLQRNRRDAICVHAAVCGDFRTVHWHSAGNVGGIYEFMAEGFKEIFHKGLKVEGLPEVPCVPFQFLLDKFGIDSIDLWSLDVEGAELEVLKTVDFSRLTVKVLMVELDGHNKEKDDAVIAMLKGHGFTVLKKTPEMSDQMKHFNTIFVHSSAWPHLAHAPDAPGPVKEE